MNDFFPTEYRNGYVQFFGRNFSVNPHVLIPRLETEFLVRNVIKNIHSPKNQTHVFDIGCGSGIIGTSLAPFANTIIFSDISFDALRVAQSNMKRHFPDTESIFVQANLLQFDKKFFESDALIQQFGTQATIIFAVNLPYIRNDDWENMSEDTKYEPKEALFGGEISGFELYEKFFAELATIAFPKNFCVTIDCEFGFDQREIAEKCVKKHPQWSIDWYQDHARIERFLRITL